MEQKQKKKYYLEMTGLSMYIPRDQRELIKKL